MHTNHPRLLCSCSGTPPKLEGDVVVGLVDDYRQQAEGEARRKAER